MTMKARIITLFAALCLLTVSAFAQSAADIRRRMEQRLPQIDTLKAQEVLGENNRGFLEERNDAFQERRDVVVAMLNDAPGLSCPTPEGAFYVYPDASGCMGKTAPDGTLIDSDSALIDYFISAARVAAVPGHAFGLSPAFRISYATSLDLLKEACRRIQGACAELKG